MGAERCVNPSKALYGYQRGAWSLERTKAHVRPGHQTATEVNMEAGKEGGPSRLKGPVQDARWTSYSVPLSLVIHFVQSGTEI